MCLENGIALRPRRKPQGLLGSIQRRREVLHGPTFHSLDFSVRRLDSQVASYHMAANGLVTPNVQSIRLVERKKLSTDRDQEWGTRITAQAPVKARKETPFARK